MRWEGCLLTAADSLALIEEVEEWCRRTGTNYNKIVISARVGVTIRHKVRVKGRRITFTTAARLRQAMNDHNRGITPEEYRDIAKPWRGYPSRPPQSGEAKIPAATLATVDRVNREPCIKCGVRADIGCKHNPLERRIATYFNLERQGVRG